jgi:hypothetical protein
VAQVAVYKRNKYSVDRTYNCWMLYLLVHRVTRRLITWPLRSLERLRKQPKDVGVNGIAVLLNRMWKRNERSRRVLKWVAKWKEWNSEHWHSKILTQFHNVPVTVSTDMTYSDTMVECLSIILATLRNKSSDNRLTYSQRIKVTNNISGLIIWR